MTRRRAAASDETPQYPEVKAFFDEHPGPYDSLQSAADAYYGQATTDEQRSAVDLYADYPRPADAE